MSFFKKLFGGGEVEKPKPQIVTPQPERKLQDLFFTDFAAIEAGEHELLSKEFDLLDKLEVITWSDYPDNKNLVFTGKYSKQRLEKVGKVVNSLVYFYGKDVQGNGNFNDNDQYDLLDKGNGDLDGWWVGRQWDSEQCKSKGLPTPLLSREENTIKLLLSF
jgi:hypothetical protein